MQVNIVFQNSVKDTIKKGIANLVVGQKLRDRLTVHAQRLHERCHWPGHPRHNYDWLGCCLEGLTFLSYILLYMSPTFWRGSLHRENKLVIATRSLTTAMVWSRPLILALEPVQSSDLQLSTYKSLRWAIHLIIDGTGEAFVEFVILTENQFDSATVW